MSTLLGDDPPCPPEFSKGAIPCESAPFDFVCVYNDFEPCRFFDIIYSEKSQYYDEKLLRVDNFDYRCRWFDYL